MAMEILLNHLEPLAKRSYTNLSHDPDRQGERLIKEFSVELENDLADISNWAQSAEQKVSVTETTAKYQKNYEKYLAAWLNSQSNCASSFITGPSNFPAERMKKLRRWAENHYIKFRNWRTRALKAIKKLYTLPEDPLGMNKQKLADALKLHAFMKLVNSTHRAFLKNPQSLEGSELPETWKIKIRSYIPQSSWIKHPFSTYQLSNNNARIKMYSNRIKVLEEKNIKAVAIGKKEIPFTDGVVILNYEEDRIQIKHNEKPSREIIEKIKSRGFRWSASNKVWQRQINNMAIYFTTLITGIAYEKFSN